MKHVLRNVVLGTAFGAAGFIAGGRDLGQDVKRLAHNYVHYPVTHKDVAEDGSVKWHAYRERNRHNEVFPAFDR